MNLGWILLGGGALAAAFGTTVAVSAAAVSRVDLTRWIARRLRGAAVASTLLGRPAQLRKAATALAALGVLVAGIGLAAVIGTLPLLGIVGAVLVVAVPTLAGAAYGIPRAVGQRWCEPIVRRTGPWFERLSAVLRPLMPGAGEPRVADWEDVLRAGSAEDMLAPEEVSVVSGVLGFTRRPVREVMTPRTDIVALPEGAPMQEVATLFAESGYSRIPVYRDSLDNILGMIYAFDLLKVAPGGELPMRPVTIVPGSTPCARVVLLMQRDRRQFAVVLDEFGGTDGIVTFEDLISVLVGDIFGDAAAPSAPAEEGAVELLEIDGATPSREIAARFGVTLPGESETIGGFLAGEAGRIPHPGDRFTLNGLEFDVLAASPTRIQRIAVRRGPVRTVALRSGPRE